MTDNASNANKTRLEDVPTPDHDVPGLIALDELSEGDTITIACRTTPLTVQQVGVRRMTLATGERTRQYAVAAVCDRTGTTFELIQQVNVVDGSVVEIVDDRGSPVRVFREPADE